MKTFRPVDRDTDLLMPPSVDEWLAEKHLARLVVDVIASLDLRAMIGSYHGSGEASYHPAVPVGIVVYGYATGVFSSRKPGRATYDSVAFRFVAANQHPDHDAIAAIRRRFLKQIEALFVQRQTARAACGRTRCGRTGQSDRRGEPHPGVAAVIDDGLGGVEHPVGEPAVAREPPDVFGGVEVGALGGQRHQGDVGRHGEAVGGVPTGLIEQHDAGCDIRPGVWRETLIWNASHTSWHRSSTRQRTAPCTAGMGPLSITAASAARWTASSRGGCPGDFRSIRPAGPCALNDSPQSRTIRNVTPPIFAASVRLPRHRSQQAPAAAGNPAASKSDRRPIVMANLRRSPS